MGRRESEVRGPNRTEILVKRPWILEFRILMSQVTVDFGKRRRARPRKRTKIPLVRAAVVRGPHDFIAWSSYEPLFQLVLTISLHLPLLPRLLAFVEVERTISPSLPFSYPRL
jgi:hypothetical protein